MKKILVVCGMFCLSGAVHAEMISSDAIGNDPVKVKLCAARAKAKPVPFEIDSRYVDISRSQHPDSTFIAIDGSSPQLIECFLREGTGRFEPNSMTPEQKFWHLAGLQQEGIATSTSDGMAIATRRCLDAVPEKINRPGFDHGVITSSVIAVKQGAPSYSVGTNIGGIKAQRHDAVVTGHAFYKSSGPDLETVNFTCLLSPSADLKAIQFK